MSDFTVAVMMTPSRSPASNERPHLPWTPLLVLAGAAFSTVTTELLPASLLLPLGGDLHVSPATAGLLVSAWALTVAIASLPLVRLTTRVPRAVLMPAALVVFSAATAGTAVAPGYGWAVASRVLAAAAHGLFWSLLVPSAAALTPPAASGRAISVVLAGPALAGVVGIPLGAVIGAAVGWRVAFALLAVLLLVAAIAVRRLHLTDPDGPSREVTVDRVDRRRVPMAVVGIAGAGGLVLTGHFLLYTYVSPLLADAGYGASGRAALLVVFGAAGLIGITLAGPLSDRHPTGAFAGVVSAFVVAAGGLQLLGGGMAAAIGLLALWGAMIGVLPPVFQTRLLRAAPAGGQDMAGAIGVSVLNVGIAGGAALGGLVVSLGGVGALPLVAASVIAVAAVGLLVSLRRPQDCSVDSATPCPV